MRVGTIRAYTYKQLDERNTHTNDWIDMTHTTNDTHKINEIRDAIKHNLFANKNETIRYIMRIMQTNETQSIRIYRNAINHINATR